MEGQLMSMHDIPHVVPLLVYRDIEAAHEFLVKAFAFTPGGLERTPDGTVVHGEVHAGTQVIWLHRVMEEEDGWLSAEGSPTTGELVVRVEDVDAHCERARAAGAEIEYGPMDQDYGVREYGARDLERRRWAFVTPLG
jgi:MerR family transcriptional regulator, thiopeptide resistance regulator